MRLARSIRKQAIDFACRMKKPDRIYSVEELKNNKWQFPDETMERGTKSHKSMAYAWIKKVPVTEVEGETVRVFVS
jgi:hypothetical protein